MAVFNHLSSRKFNAPFTTTPPSLPLAQHGVSKEIGKGWVVGGRIEYNLRLSRPPGLPNSCQLILSVLWLLSCPKQSPAAGEPGPLIYYQCFPRPPPRPPPPSLFSVFLQTLKIMSLTHLQVIRRCGCQGKVSSFLSNGLFAHV